jgi:formylglycine-generating enzyme required for sulfatase activity
VYVSWYEAAAFAAWFRTETGQAIFLPGEAQWERAARGENPAYRVWSWGNEQPDAQRTNWDKTGLKHASPVGIFPENATDNGILDMSGNVYEWCEDWYDGDYKTPSEFYRKSDGKTDPVNAARNDIVGPKESRVLRGGSFFDVFTDVLRCSCRFNYFPVVRDADRGFRLVRRP